MTPFYEDSWLTVYGGDCREVMRSMEPESVHCVVTSPPYWGLRDYGTDGQIGLEPTHVEYVAALRDVFREVWRVLRKDGTVWLNLGDAYAGSWGAQSRGNHTGDDKTTLNGHEGGLRLSGRQIEAAPHYPSGTGSVKRTPGLKWKDLIGLPWRVAFALQDDGWYLRSDIVWAKPNPMPESVTDRPTKSHEYLFLLSKSPRYYFDADAVREAAVIDAEGRPAGRLSAAQYEVLSGRNDGGRKSTTRGFDADPAGRNLRSVWTIATQPYPGAHFATFPRKLVEPCVKAGTSEKGVCPECGAPWVRVVQRERKPTELRNAEKAHGGIGNNLGGQAHQDWANAHPPQTTGWRPDCAHYVSDGVRELSSDLLVSEVEPATVLDIFGGSGTTGAVAQALGRRAVLIDLNPDYLAQAMGRNRDIPLGLDAA